MSHWLPMAFHGRVGAKRASSHRWLRNGSLSTGGALLLHFAAAGCGYSTVHSAGNASAPGARIDLRRLENESSWRDAGPVDSARLVVRDSATWRQLWERFSGGRSTRPAPAIDFSREVVLIAAWGLKGTGPHRISIDSAFSRAGVVEVHVNRRTSCRGYETQSSPMDIVRIARTRDVIRFIDHPDQASCR